ncbi:MAG: nuclear transport factor 2 family protein [Novosphingobium sp.]
MAMDAPRTIPGGVLDPAFPDADVYLGEPANPEPPPGRACALARRYVDLVNAGKYAEVAALFADDATFLEPMRPTLHGRAEIDEFYIKRIGSMAPTVRAVKYFGDDEECMVELALLTEIGGAKRWVLVSMDHFILDADGKVKSMTAFARPVRAG